MKNKTYQLNDDLALTLNADATGDELQKMKELGFDILDQSVTVESILKCHYDKKRMTEVLNTISAEGVKAEIKKGVKATEFRNMVLDFFGLFGVRFQDSPN